MWEIFSSALENRLPQSGHVMMVNFLLKDKARLTLTKSKRQWWKASIIWPVTDDKGDSSAHGHCGAAVNYAIVSVVTAGACWLFRVSLPFRKLSPFQDHIPPQHPHSAFTAHLFTSSLLPNKTTFHCKFFSNDSRLANININRIFFVFLFVTDCESQFYAVESSVSSICCN